MADIYPAEGTEGVVDIGKAKRLLATVGGMAESARKAHVAEIMAGALLDIAASLRVVAVEAETALFASVQAETVAPATLPDDVPDFLVEGDLVAVDGMTEPGEIRGFRLTEGERFADVLFPNGVEQPIAVASLERLRGDARDDDAMQAAAESTIETLRTLNAAADAEGEIDDDFVEPAGDPIDDPLAALALREAERKSKKKGGKK